MMDCPPTAGAKKSMPRYVSRKRGLLLHQSSLPSGTMQTTIPSSPANNQRQSPSKTKIQGRRAAPIQKIGAEVAPSTAFQKGQKEVSRQSREAAARDLPGASKRRPWSIHLHITFNPLARSKVNQRSRQKLVARI